LVDKRPYFFFFPLNSFSYVAFPFSQEDPPSKNATIFSFLWGSPRARFSPLERLVTILGPGPCKGGDLVILPVHFPPCSVSGPYVPLFLFFLQIQKEAVRRQLEKSNFFPLFFFPFPFFLPSVKEVYGSSIPPVSWCPLLL